MILHTEGSWRNRWTYRGSRNSDSTKRNSQYTDSTYSDFSQVLKECLEFAWKPVVLSVNALLVIINDLNSYSNPPTSIVVAAKGLPDMSYTLDVVDPQQQSLSDVKLGDQIILQVSMSGTDAGKSVYNCAIRYSYVFSILAGFVV